MTHRLTEAQPLDHGIVSGIVRALVSRYPFLCAAPLGTSVQGRHLWGVTLGHGAQRVLMAAAFHGQEWLTSLACLRLCEELCDAWQHDSYIAEWNIRRAMTDRSVVFVPMVNPDGVEIARYGSAAVGSEKTRIAELGGDVPGCWQANARGVDINHNFNAGWEKLQELEGKKGINSAAPRQWGGTCPESEPETRALTALCRRYSFRHVVALHSQGEEIYWQYGEHTPPESELMAHVLAAASGYTVAQPTDLASHGGFKDWFIHTFHRPGFTFELGKGVNPLPVSAFNDIYAKAREMLLISVLL